MTTPLDPPREIRIVEVGPRDGLQNEQTAIAAADKIEFVDRLSAAGFRAIEVTAFVSPRWVPQMADAGEVLRGIERRAGTRTRRSCPISPASNARSRPASARSPSFGGRLRDVQPEEHQPRHRGVARRLSGCPRRRERGRRPRPRLPLDVRSAALTRVRSPPSRVAELAGRLLASARSRSC